MSLARHTAYNLIGSAAPLAVSLVTVPIYIKVIGLERYGLLAICWVLVGYMELFEFGLGSATAQRIAGLQEQPPGARNEILWGSLLLSLVLGGAGALLLLLVAGPALHAITGGRSSFAQEVAQTIVWLSLLIPLSTSYNVLSGALQGRKEFLRLNLISSAGSAALGAGPLLGVLLFGPQLRILIITIVAVRAATVAVLLIVCRRTLPLGKPTLPSRQALKSLATFGGWVTGEAILSPFLLSAEKLAIGWFVSAAAVSVYMVPFNIIARLLVIPQSLASALFPRFASISESEVDATERRALRNLSVLAAPIALFAMIALKPFLILWIGRNLAEASAPIGTILIGGFWFNSCAHVPYARLQGTGRPATVVKIVLVQLVPYLALLYVAIETAGVVGAAFAWSLRAFVELFLFFAATRQLRLLTEIIFLPSIVVLAAASIAFVAPVPSLIGTVALLSLLAVSAARLTALLPQRAFAFARLAQLTKTH